MLLLPLSAAPFYSVYNFMLDYHIIGIFSHLINFFFLCSIIIYAIKQKKGLVCLENNSLAGNMILVQASLEFLFYSNVRTHTRMLN